LLESQQQKQNAVFQAAGGSSSDPYVQLCSAIVMPKLSRVVTNDWEPRNPEPMLQFMELWGPLLPGALQQQVLESLIFPKVGCQSTVNKLFQPLVVVHEQCLEDGLRAGHSQAVDWLQ